MFRGFAVPWLAFAVLWAVIGLLHIKVSGTTPNIVWSEFSDHAYWIREVIFPPLFILAAWIAISLIDACLWARKRS
jgi:hypothetical protein